MDLLNLGKGAALGNAGTGLTPDLEEQAVPMTSDEDIQAYLMNLGKTAANVMTLPSQAIDFGLNQLLSKKGLASMAVENAMHPEESVKKFGEQLTNVLGPGPQETLATGWKPPDAEHILSDPLYNVLQPGNLAFRAQTAYHGSPHKWNKVDLSKAGTGEGAATYGHGFYATDLEDVAKIYRDKLTPANSWHDDVFEMGVENTYDIFAHLNKSKLNGNEIKNMLIENMGDVSASIDSRGGERAVRRIKDIYKDMDPEKFTNKGTDIFYEGKPLTEYSGFKEGHLYKLDIPEHENLLDWDKPLSEQPEGVKQALGDALEKLKNDFPTLEKYISKRPGKDNGEMIYRAIEQKLGSSQAASEYLRSIGIPGHKYLDQGSRGTGKGTYNYVIYDPEAVNVLERNYNPLDEGKGPALSSELPKIETPEFKDWFGGSKVVDDSGKPIVVYHGTQVPEDFKEFNTPLVFTSKSPKIAGYEGGWSETEVRPNSRIMPLYIKIENPASKADLIEAKRVTRSMYQTDPKVKEYLKSKGFDGIISGNYEYVAFDPSQVKSIWGDVR